MDTSIRTPSPYRFESLEPKSDCDGMRAAEPTCRTRTRRSQGCVLLAGLVLALLTGFAPGVRAGDGNPGLAPTQARPYGATYTEWVVKYWQWVVSLQSMPFIPEDPPVHPYLDEGGDCSNGAKGQGGPVWFLAGTYSSGSVERNCTVPAGKAFMIPIISQMDADLFGQSESQLRANVTALMNGVVAVDATIDGIPLVNLQNYRFSTPLFTIGPFPPNNWFGTVAGTTAHAVADGYFLMIMPLSHGPHTVYVSWTDTSRHELTYYLNVVRE